MSIGEWPMLGQVAAAAALVILGVAVWTFNPKPTAPQTAQGTEVNQPAVQRPSAEIPQPRQRVVVALAIAPVNVRAAGRAATLTLVPDAEIVALELEGEAGEQPIARGRAVVRSVGGREVWTGSTTPGDADRRSIVARLEVPAAQLSPDDYIVQLFATDGRGRDVERNRYFFMVRQR
jgi:hypothetical protein